MRFADSETQKLIRKAARSYLADKYPWERLYAIERGDAAIGRQELREMADMGWLALVAPEDAGGGGVSLLEAAVVVDECGYAAAPLPIAVSNIAADVLAHAGEPAQGHLKRLAAAEAVYTIAEAVRRRGRLAGGLRGDGRLVRGVLPLVPFASVADFVIAPLVVDDEQLLALVPLAGVGREPVRTIDRTHYGNVRIDSLPLSECVILGRGHAAQALQDRCDALATAFGMVELGGLMQRVLEMTSEYISNRVQFGQPIAKFQAARHRAAELLVQTETTRWAAYYALWQFQEDPERTLEIWLAKHWAIRAADRVFHVSHLLTGGVGVGSEYPLHLFTQAIAAFAVRNGTMSEVVARTIESLSLDHASTSEGAAW